MHLLNTQVNNLRKDVPGGVILVFDRLVETSSLEIRVHTYFLCSFLSSKVLHAPSCLQMDLNILEYSIVLSKPISINAKDVGVLEVHWSCPVAEEEHQEMDPLLIVDKVAGYRSLTYDIARRKDQAVLSPKSPCCLGAH